MFLTGSRVDHCLLDVLRQKGQWKWKWKLEVLRQKSQKGQWMKFASFPRLPLHKSPPRPIPALIVPSNFLLSDMTSPPPNTDTHTDTYTSPPFLGKSMLVLASSLTTQCVCPAGFLLIVQPATTTPTILEHAKQYNYQVQLQLQIMTLKSPKKWPFPLDLLSPFLGDMLRCVWESIVASSSCSVMLTIFTLCFHIYGKMPFE